MRGASILPLLLLASAPLAARSAAAQDEQGGSARIVQVIGADTLFPVRGASFRRALNFEVPGDTARVVAVTASPLTNADGSEVPVRLNGGDSTVQAEVAAHGRARMELAASLPNPGTYRGNVALVTNRGRELWWYRVVWDTTPGRALVVKAPGALEKQLFLGGGLEILLTVQDSTRLPVQIYAPAMVSLTRAGNGDTAFQAPHKVVSSECAGGFTVQANSTLRCTVRLSGFTRAGRYTGEVRVAGPDVAASAHKVAVYVRRSWFLALLAILAGVALSEWLRRYLRDRRPRLERLRDAERLVDRADVLAARPGATADELEVLAALRARVETLSADPELGTSTTAPAVLGEVEGKLELFPRWAALAARVAALEPALRDEPAKTLRAVRAYLEGTGSTDEERKAVQISLNGLPAAIDAAQAKELRRVIDAFTGEVKAERDARPSDAPFLKLLQDEVEARAAGAGAHADAGRLAAAREAFDAARGAYARLLAADLGTRLEPDDAPAWMEAAAWEAFASRVRAELARVTAAATPAEAIAAYGAARAVYLHELASALRAQVRKRAADPALAKEHRDALVSVTEKLDGVLRLVKLGDAHAASGALETAQADFQEVETRFPVQPGGGGVGGRVAAIVAPDGSRTAAGAALPGGVPGGGGYTDLPWTPEAKGWRRGVAARTREIGRGDMAVSALAAGIAVLLGLSLLWVDNLIWGSFKDVIAAFLWGLGLHKVGTDAFATFGGVGSLLDTYRPKAGGGGGGDAGD
jgi:hypothetical protein